MKQRERIARIAAGLLIVSASLTLLGGSVFISVLYSSPGWAAVLFVAIATGCACGATFCWNALPTLRSRESDGEQDALPLGAYRRWAIGIGWTLVFAFCTIATGRRQLWYVTLVPAAFTIATVVHECGHAFVALLLRLHISAIQVGPLLFDLDARRFRLADIRELAGLIAVPTMSRSRALSALVFAAGPAASTAFGIVCSRASHPMIVLLGATSLIAGMGSVIPMRLPRSGLPSDGLALLDLLFRPNVLPLEKRIFEDIQLDRRPRDSRVSLEERLAGKSDHAGLVGLFAFARAMDEGKYDLAEQLLQRGTAAEDASWMLDWLLLGAMFHALIRGDSQRAATLLRAARTRDSSPNCSLATATVLATEGKLDDAAAARDEWLDHVEKSDHPPFRRAGNHWALDKLAERLSSIAN